MTDVTWAKPGDAAAVAGRIEAELRKPGAKRFAFTGGSTPIKVLALLQERNLDWSGVTIALTDDRCVPDDHPASNFAKLKAALGNTATQFERLVEGAPVAPFDLVWLGMGNDGHISSIFPTMHALVRPGPTVIATTPVPLPEEAPFDRLTLNLKALKATKAIILVVTGASKRALIEKALAGEGDMPVGEILLGANVSGGPPVTIYWDE